MLMPKRVKRRRVFRGRMKEQGQPRQLRRLRRFRHCRPPSPAGSPASQIEAARIAMTRYIKRGGQVWIKIFPDKPVTEKPAETRMGSGKGSPEYWVAVVKPGRVLFEIAGRAEEAGPRGPASCRAQAAAQDQDSCVKTAKTSRVVKHNEGEQVQRA
ncbi:MAG: 50S ribosomal protein L16 [Christensenellales bacterium]